MWYLIFTQRMPCDIQTTRRKDWNTQNMYQQIRLRLIWGWISPPPLPTHPTFQFRCGMCNWSCLMIHWRNLSYKYCHLDMPQTLYAVITNVRSATFITTHSSNVSNAELINIISDIISFIHYFLLLDEYSYFIGGHCSCWLLLECHPSWLVDSSSCCFFSDRCMWRLKVK